MIITETSIGKLDWEQSGLNVTGTMTFTVEDDGGNEIIIVYDISGDVDPSGAFVNGVFNLQGTDSYLPFTFYIEPNRRAFIGEAEVQAELIPICGARQGESLPSCLP